MSQAYADLIWSRWNREYLPQWNERSKGNIDVRQPKVNDLVWIVDENVKRAHCKMGRALEVYHGSDGRVRSALVKTEDGKLQRPVVKLAPMFYEFVFREKTGPAMLAPVNCKIRNSNSNVTDEIYNSNHLEILSRF